MKAPAKSAHPAMKQTPPSGVTAPSQVATQPATRNSLALAGIEILNTMDQGRRADDRQPV